ncbi:MFS transporter [Costertonia aggregata]|uniref:MFS transporter n=1 Tax=Costertonia aggregata TaxID=343403 RepID=A0A7H9ANJ8_9FLAO|nr:MFS transporter [Costertonia aggregata]QLG45016.1 MFS transporter [Costertonia aggregata]
MSDKQSFGVLLGIAILGTITLVVTNGMTISGISVFDTSILEEFGWSRSELKLRSLINLVASSLIMPFVGAIIDKYGVKRMLIIGLVVIAGLLYTYSLITSAWQMYTIHFLFAFAVSGAGTLAVIIMVSQRIRNNRGTAIGIALAGTSLGGILVPQMGIRLLENFGWRGAFQWEAIVPLVIAVVIFIFLKPIKYKHKASEKVVEDDETGLVEFSIQDAIKTPVFWAICFAGIFCFYSILGIIDNLFLYLSELEFTPQEAANAFSIFFAIILVAKLTSGVFTDFIDEHKLFKVQLALMIVGASLLAVNSASLIWPSLICIGLGWGGLYTLFNYIIITTFGVKSAGKIGGLISFFEGVGSGLGMWLTAFIADQTGSYSTSFWVIVGLLCIAFVISFFIKKIAPSQPLEVPENIHPSEIAKPKVT